MIRACLSSAAVAAALVAAAAPAQAPEPSRQRTIELAHQVVAAAAVETLPKQIKGFYKAHRAEMPSLALEPEFPVRGPERRFLVDRLIAFPFAELPRTEASLQSKYGDKAQGVGRLPWLVHESYARLVEAMKATDKEKILAESDVLAGLIVDLRSPLNLTDNFDGQKTGQHGLWVRVVEKLPQAVGKDLKLSPDAANYLDNPKEYVFSIMLGSYVWLDNILYLEELARRGKPGYGDPYYEDLARKVGPILREHVLSPAAEDAGSYWYTAWTVAGRPELK
ncbi:MAG: hypothetical protein ACHQM7_00090 [Vicinamibacterales bacterium]|jgi:hypothetical protein